MKLLQILNQITPLSEACEGEIMLIAKRHEIQKGKLLQRSGEVCKKLYFIEEGLLRFYYYDAEGKDVTYHFYEENNFTSNINSYYHQIPSLYNIQALEDGIVYSVNFKDFERLLEKYPAMEKVYSFVLRKFLIIAEHRIVSFQFYSAEQRYADLLHNQPSIIQRAPLGQVASFLGINQATLSRVRARQKA